MTAPAWIAADWGTTHLRVWIMSESGTVLDEVRSDDGMGALAPDQFAPALDRLLEGRAPGGLPVIACGMVGSRQGWAEAGYAAVPCAPLADSFTAAFGSRYDVRIVPGVKQDSPADVMRGEETQIAGFLSLNPNWDGVVCLPGTHTKWVHVSAEEIVSFQTCMTGDLYAAISDHTVLRHSTRGAGFDEAAFDEAVSDAMGRPEKLAARLFSLRAEGLLAGLPDAAAKARLSGLLIGAEIASTKPYWLGQNVAVIGDGRLSRLYARALAAQSVQAMQVDAGRITLAGLTAAYRQMKESAQ